MSDLAVMRIAPFSYGLFQVNSNSVVPDFPHANAARCSPMVIVWLRQLRISDISKIGDMAKIAPLKNAVVNLTAIREAEKRELESALKQVCIDLVTE